MIRAWKDNIDLSADLINSRHIIDRRQQLEDERDTFDQHQPDAGPSWADENPDDAAELAILVEVDEEGAGLFSEPRVLGALVKAGPPTALLPLARRRAPLHGPLMGVSLATRFIADRWRVRSGLPVAWLDPVQRMMEADAARAGWDRTLKAWGFEKQPNPRHVKQEKRTA